MSTAVKTTAIEERLREQLDGKSSDDPELLNIQGFAERLASEGPAQATNAYLLYSWLAGQDYAWSGRDRLEATTLRRQIRTDEALKRDAKDYSAEIEAITSEVQSYSLAESIVSWAEASLASNPTADRKMLEELIARIELAQSIFMANKNKAMVALAQPIKIIAAVFVGDFKRALHFIESDENLRPHRMPRTEQSIQSGAQTVPNLATFVTTS